MLKSVKSLADIICKPLSILPYMGCSREHRMYKSRAAFSSSSTSNSAQSCWEDRRWGTSLVATVALGWSKLTCLAGTGTAVWTVYKTGWGWNGQNILRIQVSTSNIHVRLDSIFKLGFSNPHNISQIGVNFHSQTKTTSLVFQMIPWNLEIMQTERETLWCSSMS